MNASDTLLPLENFIQAVQSQLDKAQTAMAVKARNLNLPMTFAIKDINIDLRAHVEFSQGEIRIRPASAEDTQASEFHIVFTAITRPMIEENAVAMADDPADQSLDELEQDLTAEERRKLEWVGVRTVKQLRSLEKTGVSREVGRVTNLPVDRLRQALQSATRPTLEQVVPALRPDDTPSHIKNILQVQGHNLVPEQGSPTVNIGGRPVAVLKSSDRELLLAADDDQFCGELTIETDNGLAAAMQFDLRPIQASTADANPQVTGESTPALNKNINGSIPAPQGQV